MKKVILSLIAIACIICTPVQAQLKFGIRGGVNLSNGNLNSITNLDTKNYTGYFLGPTLEFTIPFVGLGVDGSLLFNQTGGKYTYTTTNGTFNGNKYQQSFVIPLDLRYSIGLGSLANIFFTAGPSYTWNIGDRDNALAVAGQIVNSNWENQEVAINLGGGIKLAKHLELGVRYCMPVTKSAQYQIQNTNSTELLNDKSYYNKTWQLSAAYIF
jgi:hypothetical protein